MVLQCRQQRMLQVQLLSFCQLRNRRLAGIGMRRQAPQTGDHDLACLTFWQAGRSPAGLVHGAMLDERASLSSCHPCHTAIAAQACLCEGTGTATRRRDSRADKCTTGQRTAVERADGLGNGSAGHHVHGGASAPAECSFTAKARKCPCFRCRTAACGSALATSGAPAARGAATAAAWRAQRPCRCACGSADPTMLGLIALRHTHS